MHLHFLEQRITWTSVEQSNQFVWFPRCKWCNCSSSVHNRMHCGRIFHPFCDRINCFSFVSVEERESEVTWLHLSSKFFTQLWSIIFLLVLVSTGNWVIVLKGNVTFARHSSVCIIFMLRLRWADISCRWSVHMYAFLCLVPFEVSRATRHSNGMVERRRGKSDPLWCSRQSDHPCEMSIDDLKYVQFVSSQWNNQVNRVMSMGNQLVLVEGGFASNAHQEDSELMLNKERNKQWTHELHCYWCIMECFSLCV